MMSFLDERYPDDMSELQEALDKKNIRYVLQRHRGADPEVKKLIGYYPTGEWHVIIDDKYSVIRGLASWGLYEIMNISGGELFKEPERFDTPAALLLALSEAGVIP